MKLHHYKIVALALIGALFLGLLFLEAKIHTNASDTTNEDNSKKTATKENEWVDDILKGNKVKISKDTIEELTRSEKEFSQELVVVVMDEDMSGNDIENVSHKMNSSIPPHHKKKPVKVGHGKFVAMKVPEDKTVEIFLIELNEREDVIFAEPSYKRQLFWTEVGSSATPDDTSFATQWQLQNSGVQPYGIEMPKAWYYVDQQLDIILGAGDHYGGRDTVIVAVLDTGLAMNNRTVTETCVWENCYQEDGWTTWDFDASPEIPAQIWTNTGETEANSIDDDTNGFIDDYHGVNIDDYYNYETCCSGHTIEDGYPDDDYGHGTHVSSIIAGATNNAAQGAGISSNVQIMPIKVFDYAGNLWSYSIIDGLSYSIDNGADIVNMSFGGPTPSTVEEAMINQAVSADITPIAASGNTGNTTKQYPAAYNNVIGVGALNQDGSRSSYSTYGSWIDLVAPVGDSGSGSGYYQYNYQCYHQATQSNPLPCTLDNTLPYWDPAVDSFKSTSFSFASSQGTSFAAPEVAGVAALLKSLDPNYGFFHIRYILQQSAVDVGSSGFDYQTGYGLLNANNAVRGNRPGGVAGELYRTEDWFDNPGGWNLNSTRFMTSGDFDGDNNEDLCAMYYYGNTTIKLWSFMSNGSSDFSTSQWYAHYGWYPNRSKFMASGDFDNDGNDDIAIMHRSSSLPYGIQIIVLKSDGSKFQKQVWYTHHGWYPSQSSFMVAGDFDNDGNDDIAVMHDSSSLPYGININVLKSNGSKFQKQVLYTHHGWYPSQSSFMVAGDFDNDGNDDIAVMHDSSSLPYGININVLKSNGSKFQKQVWYTHNGWYPSESRFMVAGSFNGDSNGDIAIMHLIGHDPDTMQMISLNSSGSAFQKSTWYSTETGTWNTSLSKFMESADVDNDGNSEISVIDDFGSNTMVTWVLSE